MANLWSPPVGSDRISLSALLDTLTSPHTKSSNRVAPSIPNSDSPQTLNSSRSSSYRIRPARKLAAPYQHIPLPDRALYLYCWALPDVNILENLAGIGTGCFLDTGQAIGLIFSKPISMADPVCRLPLYLARGMARAYVHQIGKPVLSESQLDVIKATHSVLCSLLMELVNHELHSVTEEQLFIREQYFGQFTFHPDKAHTLGYLTIIKLCSGQFKEIDFKGSNVLLNWFTNRINWCPNRSTDPEKDTVMPSRGVVDVFPCKLSQIPEENRRGLIVRPSCLPAPDVGLFVTGEASSPSRSNNGQMVTCYRLTRHLNAARVTAGCCPTDTMSSKHSASLFPSNQCAVHPLTSLLWFQLSIIPVVLYQLNRALLSVEFFYVLCDLLAMRPSGDPASVVIPDRLDSVLAGGGRLYKHTQADCDSNSSSDHAWMNKRCVRNSCRPDHGVPAPSKLLEATTFLGASDFVDLERLELLGDSVLQLVSTLFVFSNSPDDSDEGYLTSKRSSVVSNRYLHQTALLRNWQEFSTSQPFDPPTQFSPPCFTVSEQYITKDDPRLFVRLTSKSIANMMEALVGCFHQHVGLKAACQLLHTFNISLLDITTPEATWGSLFFDDSQLSCLLHQLTLDQYGSGSPDRKLSVAPSQGNSSLDRIGVVSKLCYQFKDTSLLEEALTHNSVSPRCYQRLEFLGDGVLHYIVTNYLFSKFPDYDPGQLTMHRQFLCKNTILAYALFVRDLHPYIIHNVTGFQHLLPKLKSVHDQALLTLQQIDNLLGMDTTGLPMKMCADVFEALIGGVFLDTRGDLPRTTLVVYRLLGSLLSMNPTHL